MTDARTIARLGLSGVAVAETAATFRGFTAAGYRGDYKRVHAGHSLTTIGDFIAPILSASIDPKPARKLGLSVPQIRGR